MRIIFIRTDTENASVGVLDGDELARKDWLAGRELSSSILKSIDDVLDQASVKKEELEGVLLFKGPGSFTGLRIGASVANTLALALNLPIVSTGGENWLEKGKSKLENGENQKVAEIEYGGEANITKPTK